MNTLFLLIAKNSNLGLQKLETKAGVKMSFEELEKLIFANIHFNMNVKLEKDEDRESKKGEKVYQMVQKDCPLRQLRGENVPISFDLTFQ